MVGDRCIPLAMLMGRGSSTFYCSTQPLSLPRRCGNLATQVSMSDASRAPPSRLITLLWDGRDEASDIRGGTLWSPPFPANPSSLPIPWASSAQQPSHREPEFCRGLPEKSD